MITDEDRNRLIDALTVARDGNASWHGYPTDIGWLRDLIESAVNLALRAERGQLDLDEFTLGLNIPDHFPTAWAPPPVITLTEVKPGEPPPGYTDDPVGWWDRKVAERKARFGSWVRLEHKRGIPYFEVARPWKYHACTAQTSGRNSSGIWMEICACGGYRMDGQGDWLDRNLRPKQRP